MHLSLQRMLFTTVIALCNFFPFAQEGFTLTGTAPDSLNGKLIFLSWRDRAGSGKEFKDSTTITAGRFTLKGRIDQPAVFATLFIPRPKFAAYQFFLENRPTTVIIHPTTAKNLLDNCTFTNAPIQEQYGLLKKKLKTVDNLILRQYQVMDTAMAKADQAGKGKMNNELIALFRKSNEVTVEFIKENPGSYMSLHQLCYTIAGGPIRFADSLQNLLTHLSPALQRQPEARTLAERIQKTKATQAGQTARWTVLPTDQNRSLQLADYKGKYVLLDFWASWCGPCIQNLPAVKELYTSYGTRQFDIVGISLDDDKTRWTDAIKKHNLPWAQVSDLKGWNNAVAALYDIHAIPQYILVGPDGKILANSNEIAPIKQQLEKAMKQTATLKQ
jgi:peroxiredoxin